MTAGRPTKYLPEYCQQLIDHMSEGLSFESFAGVVSTCKQTLYTWTELHPEFLDAKSQGTEKSRLKWEKLGMAGLNTGKDEKFNATVWVFNMKNRFKWRDIQEVKQESTQKTELSIKHEDILELVKKSMKV